MTNKYRPKIIPICSPKGKKFKDRVLDAILSVSAVLLGFALAVAFASILVFLAGFILKAFL